MTKLETTLRSRVSAGERMLAPFVTAGYPNIAATAAILRAIDDLGLGCVEVGIPFSDPVADGPTIQASFTAALNAGLTVESVFAELGKLAGLVTPRIAMVSFTIAFRWGVQRFLQRAAAAGFAGVLFPDLPLGVEPEVGRLANDAGLANVMLVAPTSPPGRAREIAAASTGFVYYLSVAGITGERRELPADLPENVRQLKAAGGGKPVFVGFGIGRADQVAQVTAVADGAIVGSALVRRITQSIEAGQSADQIAGQVREYVAELSKGLPGKK
ncbi:MAG: tryptophan synthase subunit alpha [Phycisphaerae bacterium]|nr:tryptophan synthase subunit alpha [Phycisphaerae bacterium]